MLQGNRENETEKKITRILIFTIAYKCDNVCLHSAHVPIEREAHRLPSSSRVENRSHMSFFSPRQPIHNIFANCSPALTIRNITKRGDMPYRHSIYL